MRDQVRTLVGARSTVYRLPVSTRKAIPAWVNARETDKPKEVTLAAALRRPVEMSKQDFWQELIGVA